MKKLLTVVSLMMISSSVFSSLKADTWTKEEQSRLEKVDSDLVTRLLNMGQGMGFAKSTCIFAEFGLITDLRQAEVSLNRALEQYLEHFGKYALLEMRDEVLLAHPHCLKIFPRKFLHDSSI